METEDSNSTSSLVITKRLNFANKCELEKHERKISNLGHKLTSQVQFAHSFKKVYMDEYDVRLKRDGEYVEGHDYRSGIETYDATTDEYTLSYHYKRSEEDRQWHYPYIDDMAFLKKFLLAPAIFHYEESGSKNRRIIVSIKISSEIKRLCHLALEWLECINVFDKILDFLCFEWPSNELYNHSLKIYDRWAEGECYEYKYTNYKHVLIAIPNTTYAELVGDYSYRLLIKSEIVNNTINIVKNMLQEYDTLKKDQLAERLDDFEKLCHFIKLNYPERIEELDRIKSPRDILCQGLKQLEALQESMNTLEPMGGKRRILYRMDLLREDYFEYCKLFE